MTGVLYHKGMNTERGEVGLGAGAEKRQRVRVRASLGCNWGWDEHASKSGTVSSVSSEGCFIITKAPGIRGSEIHVHLWLPSYRWLKLRGRVLYEMERVGLGVAFEGVGEQDVVELMWLVDHLGQSLPAADEGPSDLARHADVRATRGGL